MAAPATSRGGRVAIVDSGSGNLRSVEKALQKVGAQAAITADPATVRAADKIVVPGQGHFGACAAGFAREGGALREAVLESIAGGVPFFGICVGMQLLFEGSDESPGEPGFGIFRGRVLRFAVALPLKIPHMGWNPCTRGPAAAASAQALLGDTPEGTPFYFVHSYYAVPAAEEEPQVALYTDHGVRFTAAVARDNVFACQFHPEKSQRAGLRLLERFVRL